jgi:hypothetical protein
MEKLSMEQKEKIVEEVLGVHPRYFQYSGKSLTVDVSRIEVDTGEPADRRGPFCRGTHYQKELKAGKIVEPL